MGYATWSAPDKPIVERDTFTCAHCGRVLFIKPRASAAYRGFCSRCMKRLCGTCAGTGRCDPFERKVERQEARYRFLKSAGLS